MTQPPCTSDDLTAEGHYFAVFHCCTTIPQLQFEQWHEEYHLFAAASEAEAQAQADTRAAAQATEYLNAEGQWVKQHAATVVELGPLLFAPGQEALYQRPLTGVRPFNALDFDVADHYVAVLLEETLNTVTGGRLYHEEFHLLHAPSQEAAQAQAAELMQASGELTNEQGQRLEYRPMRLVEVTPLVFAPKHGAIHERYFRDLTAYEQYLTALEDHKKSGWYYRP